MVRRPVLNPLSHNSQGPQLSFLISMLYIGKHFSNEPNWDFYMSIKTKYKLKTMEIGNSFMLDIDEVVVKEVF